MTNLYDTFRARFPQSLANPFLILPDGKTVTYTDLDAGTARIANLIVSLGIKTGDRVAMQVEKSPEAALDRMRSLYVGIAKIPQIMGICYTQLTDVEQEINGLLTYDRKPKFDVKAIREINSLLQ